MERLQQRTFLLQQLLLLKPLLPLFQNSFSLTQGPLLFQFPFSCPLVQRCSKECLFHALPLLQLILADQERGLHESVKGKCCARAYNLLLLSSSAFAFLQGSRKETSFHQTAKPWLSDSFPLLDLNSLFQEQSIAWS